MIIVTVSLLSAVTHEVSTLAMMTISNDGTGSDDVGNYDVRRLAKPAFKLDKPSSVAHVAGHHRKADSVWRLVAKALRALP